MKILTLKNNFDRKSLLRMFKMFFETKITRIVSELFENFLRC